jgi:glyoxylase I family protein
MGQCGGWAGMTEAIAGLPARQPSKHTPILIIHALGVATTPLDSAAGVMKITHYLHTAVLVSDTARAEQFYGGVLGLSKIDRSLKYSGAWYELGPIQLHLIEDKTLTAQLQNPEKWGRNPHLALAVANLEAAKAHLLAHGYPLQYSASGRAALFTQDPDGNIIELTEVS